MNTILSVAWLGSARVNHNATFYIFGVNQKISLYPHTKALNISWNLWKYTSHTKVPDLCPKTKYSPPVASGVITMTSWWPRWRLKSPASRLFTQPFIQTEIKENIKAPRHWPLCGEFTGTGEFPAQRASYAGNVSIWWRHHGMRKKALNHNLLMLAF